MIPEREPYWHSNLRLVARWLFLSRRCTRFPPRLRPESFHPCHSPLRRRPSLAWKAGTSSSPCARGRSPWGGIRRTAPWMSTWATRASYLGDICRSPSTSRISICAVSARTVCLSMAFSRGEAHLHFSCRGSKLLKWDLFPYISFCGHVANTYSLGERMHYTYKRFNEPA